jgi:hypothetical protein
MEQHADQVVGVQPKVTSLKNDYVMALDFLLAMMYASCVSSSLTPSLQIARNVNHSKSAADLTELLLCQT